MAKRGLIPAVALVAVLAAAGGAWAKDGEQAPAARDATTILVRFADPSVAAGSVNAAGDRLAGRVGKFELVRIQPGETVGERLAAYRARRDVVYAEPNYILSIDVSAPSDPSYGAQWGLSAINAVAGWSLYPGAYPASGGVRLAVVDTGVNASHPDLFGHVQTSLGAGCLTGTCSGSSSSSDDYGHGTHVAGIAAAATNNGVGVAGVSFSSPIIPVKVLDASGSGTTAAVANGILWAASHGARVINLSLGGTGYSATLCNAVSSATAGGALVVAAAGNSGSSTPSYPAACPGAVGVAATDSTGGSPDWSNWSSPNVFISAPGDAIYSTMWSGTSIGGGCSGAAYCTLSGTSMASPHVAGLAALVFGQGPTRTPADVKSVLARSAEKIGASRYPGLTYGTDPYGTCTGCSWHPYYGYGEIDAAAALGFAPQITSFLPLAGPTSSTVTLTGTGFTGATAVSLGFVNAPFTVDSSTQITATVPAGVAYGKWRVTNPGGTAVSGLIYSIPVPTVTGSSAVYGPAGGTATITGTGFLNVTGVTFGGLAVPSFSVISPTSILATVPNGAPYGRWRVTSPVGTGVGSIVYTVFGGTPSGLTFSPLGGGAGSPVVLSGSSFVGVTSVSLGFVNAPFVVNSSTSITATVPAGVAYGRWRVTTRNGTQATDLVFSVPLPLLTELSSVSGAVGSTVTLTGTDFRNVTGVTLGNVNASSFTVVSPTEIRATVPNVAYGRWRVTTPLGATESDVVFAVSG